MTPAAQLLLACARVTPTPASRERVADLVGSVDWDAFLALATRHGLLPLAHEHLAASGDAVPTPVRVRLWTWRERLARQNREMAAELGVLLTALASQGIRALAYKGPVLAQELYGDVGLRQFGDLDILVSRANVLRAQAVLQARGYHCEFALAPAIEQAFLASGAQYHLAMTRDDRAIVVELHWKLDPDVAVEPGDPDAVALGSDELLLFLLVHGSKHRWSNLGWVVDVAEAIRRGGVDWAGLEARAQALHCERRVALGLWLVHRLLEAPVPDAVLARCPRGIGAIGHDVERDLLALEPKERRATAKLMENLHLFDTFGQRVKHLFDTLWSPSLVEWTRWPLPRALFFLYPPLRVARLAWKHLTFSSSPRIPAGATPRTPAPPPR